jgi:hypothetical protein
MKSAVAHEAKYVEWLELFKAQHLREAHLRETQKGDENGPGLCGNMAGPEEVACEKQMVLRDMAKNRRGFSGNRRARVWPQWFH